MSVRPGRRVAVVFVAGLLGVPAAAQTPPPETAQFGRLAGDWDVEMRTRGEDGAWRQEPVAAVWSWRLILGGHAVQDFWTQPADRPGTWAWGTNLRIFDPEAGEWRVRWTASDDRDFMELTARQEGADLRVYGTHASGRPLRITFSDITDQTFRWEMEVQAPDGVWHSWSRMDARRRAERPSGPAARAGADPPARSRDLEFRVRVRGSGDEVLARWLDEATANRFFGVGSHIEPRVGGAYEISFLPGDDPAARANSTAGSRILAMEPGRHLAFEWRLPPWAREPARSAPPTRVDLRVETATDPAGTGATILHLRHSGFGDGPAWDEVRRFFQRNWWEILTRYRRLDEVGG